MADLTITAANVIAQGGASKSNADAGEAITAGEALAKDSSGDLVLASDASATLAAVVGISLNEGAAGQPIDYHTGGDINMGATLAVGKHYCLSTDGAIAPVDDIAGSEFPTYIGYAISTSILRVQILKATVAAAGAVS